MQEVVGSSPIVSTSNGEQRIMYSVFVYTVHCSLFVFYLQKLRFDRFTNNGGIMVSERDYAKSIIDTIPEEYMDEVIEYLLSLSDGKNNDEKFELVSRYILEKYHKAFEELAK